MKFRFIMTCALAAAVSSAFAQGYKDGIEYYKADRYDNASELLKRNLSNADTDKAASFYYLGCIALHDGNKAEAAKYFNQGLEANPDYAYNYVGKGELELLGGDLKGAEASFKQAEGKAKKDAGVHVAIARAYFTADPALYAKQIAKKVEKARSTDDKSADLYMFEGDQFAAQQDWGRAAGRYEMATQFQPDATEGYVKGAAMLFRLNPGESTAMLQRLLDRNPQSALGQRELADTYYELGKYTDAAREYGRYIQNPNHFKQDEDRYSFLLFYGGDYKKGYDYATQLLAQNPDNFTAMRYQFMNAAQMPDMKDKLVPMAEKLLAKHSKANKFAAIDYTLISEELKNAGRVDEAVAVLQEGIKDMPEYANFNKQLAMLFVDANRIGDASDAFEGYFSKVTDPSYSDFMQQATFAFYGGVENKKADPARAAQYFGKAAEYADKAAKKNPDMHKSAKMMGDIKIQNAAEKDAATIGAADYQEAIRLLEALPDPAQYASDAKNLYNYMGNYYLERKDKEQAKVYFNKYLQYDPNNADYRKFVESL